MLRTMLLYEMMGIGGGGLCCNNCDGATFEHLGSLTKINYFEILLSGKTQKSIKILPEAP